MSLYTDIYQYIQSGETSEEKLGLEIEHFIVDDKGFPIDFYEVSSLIEEVATKIGSKLHYMDGYPVGYQNERYAISLEPSCQFEISISPFASLEEIKNVYREFRDLWEPVFAKIGYHFVTAGNLPLVELGSIRPENLALSPKKRYQYMNAYFKQSGAYGKYMMRASASTQVSVDYSSESDLVRKLRVLQKISPLLMMMMESKTDASSTLPKAPDRPHLLRIQEWDDLDKDRTGFFPYVFTPDFGYDTIADVAYHLPLILLTDRGVTTSVGHQSAKDLLLAGLIREEELDDQRRRELVEHILSMEFFHFRIKKYIEIRVADSVPIEKALGYAALLKGLIYNDRNLSFWEKELADINTAEEIQAAVERIEKDGNEAILYKERTVSEWAKVLLQKASETLPPDEKEYLTNV